MPKQAFQLRIVSEARYRVEVPWGLIGGKQFPAVEALFKTGVIENQAWRVADDGTHFCIFYFREEESAEKFLRAFGGTRLDG